MNSKDKGIGAVIKEIEERIRNAAGDGGSLKIDPHVGISIMNNKNGKVIKNRNDGVIKNVQYLLAQKEESSSSKEKTPENFNPYRIFEVYCN